MSRVSPFERFRHAMESETTSGLLVIGVATIALILANSPLSGAYSALSHAHVGPSFLGLHLTVHAWAADGILTLFFFVVGLELKTEFVTGALRDMRQAALPMIAAACGMAVPATVYALVIALSGTDAAAGWAIPTATDIAFAVAILALFGRGLPPAARTFLLTLAVVDDLLAIIVIAIFYSSGLLWWALGASVACVALFALLTRRGVRSPWILIPIGVLAWYCMHASGIHATIAGVALGLVVPARITQGGQMTHDFAHAVNPWSAGIALPLFAFFAAGVNVVDSDGGIAAALTDPVTIAVAIAMPIGKFLGIWGSVTLLVRFTKLRLGHGVDVADIAAIGLLAGIGFTVAMLIADLAFPGQELLSAHARLGVIIGTLLSVILSVIALRARLRVHARGRAATSK